MLGLANGVAAEFAVSWGAVKEADEVSPAGAAGVAGMVVDAGWSNCTAVPVDDGFGNWRKMEDEAGVGDAAAADSLNFDGDRERDRRSDRTAEPTSTWVGEGRASVPPLPLEYDIVALSCTQSWQCGKARTEVDGFC